MAWMELHQTMARHRKTLCLANTLKISRREAIGILVDLWTWGIDNADKNGLLLNLGPPDIATALDWPLKKCDVLVEAFVGAGYIDLTEPGYVLHDWYTYCGKLNEKREDTKRRVEAHRNNRKNPVTNTLRNASVTRTERVRNAYVTEKNSPCNASTVPNRTVPNIYINQSINKESMDGRIDTLEMTLEEAISTQQDQDAILAEAKRCGLPVTQQGMDTAMELYAAHGLDKLLEAIRKAGEQPKDKWHWRYVKGILASKPKDESTQTTSGVPEFW